MYIPSEKKIDDMIEGLLATTPALRSADVHISESNGEVTLKGVVENDSQRRELLDAVRGLDGVTSVIDQLRIRGQGSQTASEYFEDSLLTAAIKAKLLEEKGLASLKIHVETKDGIATLKGAADSRDRARLAEQTAKSTKGVHDVVNLIEVAP